MTSLPIQIQSGYRADWHNFLLRAETDAGCWTAEVIPIGDTQERGTAQPLYTARRGSLQAAKIAAVEFAMFRAAGTSPWENPERVAGHLPWKSYWQR
ncbi:MAG TPA: hypothetical protein VGH38_26730 [Bryobacteraceae bacterium]|jgi:hypothetical protein